MRTVRPLLPGEFDANACANLCGRPRNPPSCLCSNCLADYSAKAAQEKRERAQRQLDEMFADGQGVSQERIQLHHLSEYMDPAIYWRDDFTRIFYRTKQEELRRRHG